MPSKLQLQCAEIIIAGISVLRHLTYVCAIALIFYCTQALLNVFRTMLQERLVLGIFLLQVGAALQCT
jgi:hypothetical protein